MVSNDLKMLIVDDDEMVIDLLELEMQEFGFQVTTAHDGVEGLEAYKTQDFDVVLTDFKMPKMDGLQMVEKMLAEKDGIPVLMLSGFFDADVEAKAQQLGVFALIEKPLNRDNISRIFEELGFVS